MPEWQATLQDARVVHAKSIPQNGIREDKGPVRADKRAEGSRRGGGKKGKGR